MSETKNQGSAPQADGRNGPCQPAGPGGDSGRAAGTPPKIDLEDLFTPAEAAAKLKMKLRTIREWMKRRWISYTEGKRLKYIRGEDLREMLQRNFKPALRRPPSNAPRFQGGDEEEKGKKQ